MIIVTLFAVCPCDVGLCTAYWRQNRGHGTSNPELVDVDLQAAVEAVERKMPRRLKRKRKIQTDDGLDAGMEEYYDYVFPEEAGAAPNLKLLERAQAWKRQKQMEATEDGIS